MEKMLQELMRLKNEEIEIKAKRINLETELYSFLNIDSNIDTNTVIKENGLKLTIKPTFTVKVDQEKAVECANLFKSKYEISYSQYKKLTPSQRIYADEIVTINITKPSFSVEMI